jgi:cholinesterase
MTELTVMTSNGPVMGVKKTSVYGIDYISFHKIPFAKAPVGDLKFKVREPCKFSGNCKL